MNWDSQPAGSEALRGLRVLVVDDEPVIALDIEQILCDAGASVVGPACSVEEALGLAQNEILSAAVLDVRLNGEMIGPVADALAERNVPFVFYSGQVDSDAVKRSWPASGYVAKPAPARMLVSAVHDVVEHQ